MAKEMMRDPDPIRLDEFIPAEKLAKAFGVSTQTVLRWREQGLPYVPVGQKIYFRASSVAVWLASREKTKRVARDA
jgi:phage terminase Nu1 subunit (DNA packaging protein)